jgi:hypothetical protein
MIQRVQTVYLLLAAGLMACVFWLPLATFSGAGQEVVLHSFGMGEGAYTWPLAVLVGLTAALLFVNIFLYRWRWLQLRLCFSATVLTLGSQGFVAWYVWRLAANPAVEAWKAGAVVAFPLAAFVLVLLAIRGIVRDDRLIKSLNRMR